MTAVIRVDSANYSTFRDFMQLKDNGKRCICSDTINSFKVIKNVYKKGLKK